MMDKTQEKGFRLAVAGKGGVGKTTLVALLADLLVREGRQVLAADEDPQMNLALTLGIPFDQAEKIVPLSRNREYIEEKIGAPPGASGGGLLRLNPDVDDVVERFGFQVKPNLSLLAMGSVDKAAAGCLCPENNLLKAVMRFIVLKPGEVILVDTPAGLEHFGRGILQGFSVLLVVAEPTLTALQVARRSVVLAQELEIPRTILVVNKIHGKKDREKVEAFIKGSWDEPPPVHLLPYADDLLALEPAVGSILSKGGKFSESVQGLYRYISGLMPAKPI